jgi:hypothetical protein
MQSNCTSNDNDVLKLVIVLLLFMLYAKIANFFLKMQKCSRIVFLFVQFGYSKTLVDDDTFKRVVLLLLLFALCAEL